MSNATRSSAGQQQQRPLQLSSALLAGPGSSSSPSAAGSGASTNINNSSNISGGAGGQPRSGGANILQQFQYSSSGTSGTSSAAHVGPASSGGAARGSGVVMGGGSSASAPSSSGAAVVTLNGPAGGQGNVAAAPHARALGPARLKLDELFQHWAQLPSTAKLVSQLCSETIGQLGGGAASSSSSATAAAAQKSSPKPSPLNGAALPGASSPSKQQPGEQSSSMPIVFSDGDSSGEDDFELPQEQPAERPSIHHMQHVVASSSDGAASPSSSQQAVAASPPAGAGTKNPRGGGGGTAAAGMSASSSAVMVPHANSSLGLSATATTTTTTTQASGGAASSQQHPLQSSNNNSGVPNVAVSMDDLPAHDLGGFNLGGSTTQTNNLDSTANGANNSLTMPAAAASITSPLRGGGNTGPQGGGGKAGNGLSNSLSASNTAAAAAGGHTPPTRTPRSAGLLTPNHSGNRLLGAHQGVLADEMDVAHRYGALSPRALSPAAMNLEAPVPGAAKSPFDVALRSPRGPLGFGLEGPPKSRSPSPQPSGGSSGAFGGHGAHGSPPLAMPNTTIGGGGDDSDREGATPRQLAPGRRRSVSSLGSSFSDHPLSGQQAAKLPVATVQDIPRFYYARGRQTSCAPTLFDEVASKQGGAAAAESSAAVRDAAARSKAADDKEGQAMTRIINQLATAATKRSANGRLPSAAKRPTTSGGPDAQAVQAAVRNLTGEAFGLPRVLASVVAAKIVKQPGNNLTLTSARGFYDACIAHNSVPRRIFETLIGSSPQAPATDRNMPAGQRRNYLVREDFAVLLASLVDSHPGLTFLKEAADFQSKYIETVLHRIFYDCDPRDTGRITWEAFARSGLAAAIQQLAETDEINQVLAYFSYEHFYVLYCRFWELDSDKDLLINAADLERYYPEQTANDLVVQRVLQGAGRKVQCRTKDRLGYDDFVYFCISEEDKTSPRALRFWFRLLDLDGDGLLSGYELASFYEITRKRVEQLTGEAISFPDVMCQIADMLIGPGYSTSGSTGSLVTPSGGASPGEASPLMIMSSAGGASASPMGALPAARVQMAAVGGGGVTSPSASARAGGLTGLDLMTRLGGGGLTAVPSRGHLSSPASSSTSTPTSTPMNKQQQQPAPHTGPSSKPPTSRPTHRREPSSTNAAGSSSTPSAGLALGPAALAAGVDPMTIAFTLADFQRRPLAASVAITMITNVGKFLQYEQRDPFVVQQERSQGPERNDWDRFCRGEYDRMSLAEDEA